MAIVESGFGDAVASSYERFMVPMIFAPYAADIARRVAERPGADVLDVASGTGIVPRMLVALGANRPRSVVATDLAQPMLDVGRSLTADATIRWQQADAAALPFADASFDVVVCQFGAMFFPDRVAAFREARRVLRSGGRFLFTTWDVLAANELADVVNTAVGGLFPDDPPRFFERVPHGYADAARIAADVAASGFVATPSIEHVRFVSRAKCGADVAHAFVRGTPLRLEIEHRDPSRLDEATAVAERALTERFGADTIEGWMRALLVSVDR